MGSDPSTSPVVEAEMMKYGTTRVAPQATCVGLGPGKGVYDTSTVFDALAVMTSTQTPEDSGLAGGELTAFWIAVVVTQ